MFNIDQKDYIAKLSDGKTINFFYQNGSGIYMRTLVEPGTWSDPVIAVRDTTPYFSICLCSDNKIYLLYQNTRGDILYSVFNGENIGPANILINKKSQESVISKLFVKQAGSSVLFLYTVHQLNETILAFQILSSNGELTRPSAIDYISAKKPYFCTANDRNGDLYIFYNNKSRQKASTGFRKYNHKDSKWEKFEALIDYEGDYSLICADFDRHDNIHLIWQKKYPQRYELVYSLKHLGADVWDEKVLCKASEPFVNASILVAADTVICYWVNKSGIFYSISRNNGITWKGIEKYNHDNTDEYCYIDYYSNDISDIAQSPAINVPGRYINGFELAFLSSVEKAAYSRHNIASEADPQVIQSFNSHEFIEFADEIEKRVKALEARVKSLEDRGSSKKLEPQQAVSKDIQVNTDILRIPESVPLMEGTCFKNITWDYIEGLNRKNMEEG